MILNIKKNQDYIFDFTSLSNEDVKKYSIIDGVFFVEDSSNSENKLENKKLKELAIVYLSLINMWEMENHQFL